MASRCRERRLLASPTVLDASHDHSRARPAPALRTSYDPSQRRPWALRPFRRLPHAESTGGRRASFSGDGVRSRQRVPRMEASARLTRLRSDRRHTSYGRFYTARRRRLSLHRHRRFVSRREGGDPGADAIFSDAEIDGRAAWSRFVGGAERARRNPGAGDPFRRSSHERGLSTRSPRIRGRKVRLRQRDIEERNDAGTGPGVSPRARVAGEPIR